MNLFKQKSIQDMFILFMFLNFYLCFIQRLNKISKLFILILEISTPALSNTLSFLRNKRTNDKVDGESNNKAKNLSSLSMSNRSHEVDYFLSNTKIVFNFLRNSFIKSQISYYFDPKYYIGIKTNMFD